MSEHFYTEHLGWGGGCNRPESIRSKEHYCNKCKSVAIISDVRTSTYHFSTDRGDGSQDETTATITCKKCNIIDVDVIVDYGDIKDESYYSISERQAYRNYD